MKKSRYIFRGFLHAAGVFAYILVIAWVLSNAQNFFEDAPEALAPVFMLLLFVVSATVTGLVVLGKPIHLYLIGSRTEAVMLLGATVAWLMLFLGAVGAWMAAF